MCNDVATCHFPQCAKVGTHTEDKPLTIRPYTRRQKETMQHYALAYLVIIHTRDTPLQL